MQARLLGIFKETHELRRAGRIEQTVLAVNRSDYMLDEPSSTLMQACAGLTDTVPRWFTAMTAESADMRPIGKRLANDTHKKVVWLNRVFGMLGTIVQGLNVFPSRAYKQIVDYHLPQMPQVEMNTIASSFGCLSTIVSQMHRYTTSRSEGPQPVRIKWRVRLQ